MAALRSPPAALRAEIGRTVARVFEVDAELLGLPTRGQARVALARQVAMYLAHTGCGLTLTEAGCLFDRDRTTAAHACAVVERRRDQPTFDRAIALLETIVRIISWPREAS